MRRFVIAWPLLIVLTGCVTQRPATWAQPIDTEGLPNLYRVSDTLYRGAEPNRGGLEQLDALNIRTVINLQRRRTDRLEAEALGLHYVEIPVNAWQPREEQVVEFLRKVADPNGGPYLVHCQHGADRTGMMVAAYRIVVQGWSRDEAIREMRHGGYNFHWHLQHLARFVRELDVERLRREAGID